MKYLTLIIFTVLILFNNSVLAQPNYPKDANEAKVISSDIKNFIEAFNALSRNTDSIQVLQKLYFDKASIGMTEYIRRFNLNSDTLFKSIQKHPKKYLKIKEFYSQILTFETNHIEEMKEFKKVLPNAVYPPTYLIVGDYRGIANGSKFGQLVTIEKRLEDLEILKTTIIHELTHFQQAISMGIDKYIGVYSKKDNMLELILREGGAEFIAYKLVRKNESQFKRLEDYEKDELELWEKFKKDLEEQDKSFWLTIFSKENDKGYPMFLGYPLGYKIVEAYYNQAENKTKAIGEILNITDASEFFDKSDYNAN
jgi:hypothetical protein